MPSNVRPSAPIDGILLILIIAVVLFGVMMIGSASAVIADRFRGDELFYLKHQLIYGVLVGMIMMLVGVLTPYRFWRMWALPGLIASLVLLGLVFVPQLQVASGGAARWIGIGPITIQPSEMTKLALIIYLAALFETKSADMHSFRQSVAPFLVILSIIGGLIMLQPDLGTLISIVVIAGSMMFAGGIRLRHLLGIAGAGMAALLLLINMAAYRINRIMVYLHPELDPQGIGYQINQSLLAVGTGGLWGLGFGRSRQKYHYLPEPAGDSIFAVISEELGLIRTSLVLMALAAIGWRGLTIAMRAPDIFGRLLSVGISMWIVSQAFINIGATLAVTPMTGIPLPFISYGGSALVTMMFASGVLLNISRYRT